MFPSIAIGIYVRDTFLLSNCLGLHNPFWTYGCFYSWIYFLIIYSARILEEFHLIRYWIYHPLYFAYHKSSRQEVVIYLERFSLSNCISYGYNIAALHRLRILLHSSDAPLRLAGLSFWPTILLLASQERLALELQT
jgi:hypothetical protein